MKPKDYKDCKDCKNCPNYTDGICCQSRPSKVLSQAYNYFCLPKTIEEARQEDK